MDVLRAQRVHANPVYRKYLADPFVWKSGDNYYAIGTGELEAQGIVGKRIFPVLCSPDFFLWDLAGYALVPHDRALGTHHWAPEVVEHNGTFHLFYSVGQADKNHQLRVALSNQPAGPYHDSGKALLDPKECPFAIDAHAFRDDDGQWYLFYARDFLDFSDEHRAGTALMVTRMKSMTELDGPGRVVLRARQDWQRFEANRLLYGQRWDWHTLEGPFVRRHQGRYYCFYSGGRWENDTYGVDYGVADSVLGPYSDAGNEGGPRVLRTVPRQVIGPGHNSIVTGPDENDFLVYHAWDPAMTARRMFIDRLLWTPAGPRCDGPTIAPPAND